MIIYFDRNINIEFDFPPIWLMIDFIKKEKKKVLNSRNFYDFILPPPNDLKISSISMRFFPLIILLYSGEEEDSRFYEDPHPPKVHFRQGATLALLLYICLFQFQKKNFFFIFQ